MLVVGGGTGGTAAGLQSSRMGVKTVIAEEGPWLGGMLSAAGVSATDGNHSLPSGIWNEFRNEIYKVYGGAEKVATGWISNTLFEPHVADSIFKAMAAREKNLEVRYNRRFLSVIKKSDRVTGAKFLNTASNKKEIIMARQVVEATELGDVIAAAGVPFDIGMESGDVTGENVGITETNDIIQDLTWVAILKDFGKGSDKTIPKPANYTPDEFDASSTNYYNDKTLPTPNVDAQKMLDYARLPRAKYMLNWPLRGNDIYLNVIPLSPEQRNAEFEKAKQQTLRFVYFIQTQLGYKNLGLATDEFPTKDHLALMPYHREGRRVKGKTRFLMDHIATPFNYRLYRTGISVGDYPIDHHHKKNPEAPQHLEFYPIPSFNIPLGSLIPENAKGLIVCDKSISVSNVVNGTTRLQPVVLLTGQAAGALAALCVKQNKDAEEISIRDVQSALLDSKAIIMPYIDAGIDDTHWLSIQRIGATGILRGTGVPYKWANQTWFYPDSAVDKKILHENLKDFGFDVELSAGKMTLDESLTLINQLFKLSGQQNVTDIPAKWSAWGLGKFENDRKITRREWAVMLDKTLNPFELRQVNFQGDFVK